MIKNQLPFIKMEGIGNDFVVLKLAAEAALPSPELVRALSHRKRGVGCDQLLVIRPQAQDGIHARLDVINADGSGAEACGNGTRCVVAHLGRTYGVRHVLLETPSGLLEGTVYGDEDVEATQGEPRLMSEDPLDLEEFGLGEGIPVDLGNPHLVVFVEPNKIPLLDRFGERLTVHPFFPNRTNVEFVVMKGNGLHLYVWERGAGRTQACASGACAAAFAALSEGLLKPGTIPVYLEGGHLWVTWRPGEAIRHRGPAREVFEGVFYSDIT
jgi:diaminopimelate epimerase